MSETLLLIELLTRNYAVQFVAHKSKKGGGRLMVLNRIFLRKTKETKNLKLDALVNSSSGKLSEHVRHKIRQV